MNRLLRHTIAAVLLATLAQGAIVAPAWSKPPLRTGSIRVQGNHRIQPQILLREIPLRPGDPFDRARLDEGKRRIQNVPGVDYADIRVHRAPEDSVVDLTVFVTEKSSFGGNVWFERGLENEVSVGGRLTERNLRGRSEFLSGSVLAIGGTVATLEWRNPWIGSGRRVGISLDAFYKNYRYVYDDFGSDFLGARIDRVGGNVSLFLTMTDASRAFIDVGYEHVNSNTDGVTASAGGDDSVILGAGVSFDSRNSRFPWRAAVTSLRARYVDPGGLNIAEGEADLRAYLPLFGRTVVAARARARYRDGDAVPLYRREHVGGSVSLRGYDFGAQNGASSILAGAEYRVALNFSRKRPLEDVLFGISLHAFVDTGTAFEPDQSPGTFLTGYGLGAMLLNRQVKGLRFDYGWDEDGRGRFHFDFGLMF